LGILLLIYATKNIINKEVIKMASEKRFEKIHSDGAFSPMKIWVDKETGVNYLVYESGYACGMTPLLDREGKPIISPIVRD
jgi:hypothetical protein